MKFIKNRTILEQVLKLPEAEIEKWETLINQDRVDYSDMGFPELSTVWWKTVRFPDGFEIDLKVCTDTSEDGDLWSEAVLFDQRGQQYAMTEVSYGIEGEWELEWFDHTTKTMHQYRVIVKKI